MTTSHILYLRPTLAFRLGHLPVVGSSTSKYFATLTKKQKEHLADGPDLADFIQDPDLAKFPANIVKKKGERSVYFGDFKERNKFVNAFIN